MDDVCAMFINFSCGNERKFIAKHTIFPQKISKKFKAFLMSYCT